MWQSEYQTADRMLIKEQAIPWPAMDGLSLLDVGCDGGYWCDKAYNDGASYVLGLDRGRVSRGVRIDVPAENRARYPGCHFAEIDLGRQWLEFGKFDVVLMMSMYHHVFTNCPDHRAIWYWLQRHCRGEVIWENPITSKDEVVMMNMPQSLRALYTDIEIMKAATAHFDVEVIGPALHSPTREVWRCKPRAMVPCNVVGEVVSGAGGAAPCWEYGNGRRIAEVERILGARMFPGSLNVRTDFAFDWSSGYYRAQILDVEERGKGLNVAWTPRWCRFYPVLWRDVTAWAFRFEGESYPSNFVELVSPIRLRDV